MPKPVAGIDRRPAPDGHVHEIPIRTIHPSDWNPRTVFDDHELDELATSIAQTGLLNPLIVEPDPVEPGQYLLMDGERRYRALQRAGAGLAPCIVRRFATAEERLTAMLTTSLQRADLTPLDEAAAYQRLLDLDLTQSDIATRVSRSKGHVSKRLALLKLPAAIRTLIETGDVNLEIAGRLGALPKPTLAKVITDATGHAGSTPAEALTRELDLLDQATAPKKPKTKAMPPARADAAQDSVAPPAAGAVAAHVDANVAADRRYRQTPTDRLEHLGRIVLGQTQPRYSPNSLMIDVCRALRTAGEINVCAGDVDVLLGGEEIHDRLAASPRPTERTRLAAAWLLTGLELARSSGGLDSKATTAMNRLFKETGYTAENGAAA